MTDGRLMLVRVDGMVRGAITSLLSTSYVFLMGNDPSQSIAKDLLNNILIRDRWMNIKSIIKF